MNTSHNKRLKALLCGGLMLSAIPLTTVACPPYDDAIHQIDAEPIESWQNDEAKMCGKALSGEMTVDIYKQLSTNISDEKILECALGKYIADPFYTKAYYKKVWKVKTQLAEFLFTKELDVNYDGGYGGNFAHDIVFTSYSEEWRIKMLKIFKEKGGDLFKKNELNREPLDYARSNEYFKIVEYLESIEVN